MKIQEVRDKLCSIQADILKNPFEENMHKHEEVLEADLCILLQREENIAHQRSRVQWIELGDQNNAYFHKKISSNWNNSKILSLIDANGTLISGTDVIKDEAVHHFNSLFSTTLQDYPGIDRLSCLVSKRITSTQAMNLVVKATDQEIFNVLKSKKKNKAPGPNGFNVNFFIATWNIVGKDFLKAIHFFLETGSLPHYANSTTLGLIPKCPNPSTMVEFRPISCCNTVYKCLSKLIAQRFNQTLPTLVDKSQAAFVKGRSISDNNFMAQEVFNGYNSSRGAPKAAFKMDLHKDFDSCHWQFIIDILILRGYPPHFIKWIHSCLTSAKFSVKINGEVAGYFSSSRGI
ncbi:hypothetical protein POM88_037104 [Heracleum sosnowskyi]|uniref:Reverse transcriptase domain-containing protein n=1 Tax=Heracleum sosnowskyi TaxID=360622 RepID=A0AAD8MFJ8_9APIA|nr:hypothetical protein POM88_037104 [Heracleum sosnowskyi]